MKLNTRPGMQFLIGQKKAIICDEDPYYFTILCEGDFRRMGKAVFWERIGYDEKAKSARLFSR